ncbi:MAG: nucleotidyltransferase family protein [Ignavibacteriaceae bacterium]|nr:nucleotidyltransferase family protein [Ignavibacteriaceae bacterium]
MKKYSSSEIIEILKGHRALLKKYSVIRIGLFGSFSRNEATKISDIDLLVDFEDKSFDNFIDLAFELENIFGRKVDLLTEKGISPYIFPLIKNKILWYEA